MVAELVQLPNSHGNRYTAPDREAAYQAWRIAAGRSLRKTADLTKISHGTLGNWSKDDRWQERARQEDDEEAKSLRGALRAVVNSETLKSIQTAVDLRDDATGDTPSKVRLDAAIWLAGLSGVAPVKQTLDLTKTPPSDRQPIATRGMSPDELLALELEYTEGKRG
ncbi:MAG: hypothetical protein M3464_12115 [Chloroflexota bacterium]|nr:hypothetical protein [Chloroflexota bacterium]